MANFNTNDSRNTVEKLSKHKQKIKERNSLVDKHALWNRIDPKDLQPHHIEFLQSCMSENLNHARHVENERLTFNTVFLALVAGVLAFCGEIENQKAVFYVYLAITLAGFLSILLTIRWNNAFDRHQTYAQECYKLIHRNYFGEVARNEESKQVKELIDGLGEVPLYSFKIDNPIAYTHIGKNLLYKLRTRTLYNAFYGIVQLLLIACTVLSYMGKL